MSQEKHMKRKWEEEEEGWVRDGLGDCDAFNSISLLLVQIHIADKLFFGLLNHHWLDMK